MDVGIRGLYVASCEVSVIETLVGMELGSFSSQISCPSVKSLHCRFVPNQELPLQLLGNPF